MDFKLDDAPKAPTAHQLAPARKAGRQDWELQPTDGFSTPAELYLKAVPDDSSSDGGDGEDTYAALQIGDELPHFKAASTNEKAPVDSREYGENQWLVIVTFCRTYDPVATSELTSLAELQKDFGERRIKILGLAVNTKTTIEKWVSATEELSDVRVEFPIVADSDAVIASTIGMVRHGQPPHPTGVLHASMILIVNPNNRVEVIQQYPESVGRNFHEVLRAVDALNMTFLHTHVATGGNWASGEDVFIGVEINAQTWTRPPSDTLDRIQRAAPHTHAARPQIEGRLNFDSQVFINNDVEPIRAKSLFPRGFVEIKPWFRLAPSPQLEILDAAIDAFDEGTRSQMTDTQASTLASRA